jgi:hypothetical protein
MLIDDVAGNIRCSIRTSAFGPGGYPCLEIATPSTHPIPRRSSGSPAT